MSIPKFLAVPAGLQVGLSYTLAIAIAATASAATQNPWNTAPTDWGRILHTHLYHPLLDVRIERTGIHAPVQPDEFALCIANHPSTYGNSAFFGAVGEHISPSVMAVAKKDLELIMRIPSRALNLSIPIDRDDRVAAKRAVLEQVPGLARRSGVLVIFPDTTRPTERKRLDAREKWIGRIPDFDEWSTLPPRSGTLFATLQALPYPVRVFNVTHAFDRFDESWFAWRNLYGATYHFQIETFMSDDLPQTEPGLQAWLNERWREKNQRIAMWRSITQR